VKYEDPDGWVRAVQVLGYRAAYCPVKPGTDAATVKAYAAAAERTGIVIAEVGAWSNPLSPDETQRTMALAGCKQALGLAEAIGARCCVNIAGSRGAKWDGPSPLDLTPETFDMIVTMVRDIVDAVKPTRSFYTLETMPWMYPDSTDSYLKLIKAIDRPAFAVHFDPVNLVNCPARFFNTKKLLREAFRKLGDRIRSCHGKDIALRDKLTVHLDEVRPGTGGLDYKVFLKELARLDPDTPLMLEHLPGEEEYKVAAEFVRQMARQLKLGAL
jgi:sugar phosphate isomerase/epimerase